MLIFASLICERLLSREKLSFCLFGDFLTDEFRVSERSTCFVIKGRDEMYDLMLNRLMLPIPLERRSRDGRIAEDIASSNSIIGLESRFLIASIVEQQER